MLSKRTIRPNKLVHYFDIGRYLCVVRLEGKKCFRNIKAEKIVIFIKLPLLLPPLFAIVEQKNSNLSFG